MKNILSIFSIGIIVISVFILLLSKDNNEYVVDDEQEGLNKQIVIKFSHVVAENTPKGLAAQRFAQLVHQKTNNRVKVEVFPNGILYSDEEAVEALKQGSIQMIAPASSKVASYIPELEILDLPFAFSNYDSLHRALSGDLGTTLLGLMEKEGLLGLSFWSNGFKQVTSNHGPLQVPTDFFGQEFRVMPGQVIDQQYALFFVKAKQIPFNLTYQNLENGTIDGQENTLSNIYSKKFYEVQDYMTLSNHGFMSYIVLMNQDFWNELPSDIQQAIEEAMKETTLWNFKHSVQMNKQALLNIKASSNIKIHELTDEEKEKWEKKFQTLYEEFQPIIGEELMEKLKEYH